MVTPQESPLGAEFVRVRHVQPDMSRPMVGYQTVGQGRAVTGRDVERFDDMLRSSFSTTVPSGPMDLVATLANGGTIIRTTADVASGVGAQAQGVADFNTSLSNNGLAALINDGFLLLGLGWYSFSARVRLVGLSSAADEFEVHVGFSDNFGIGDATDGVYFRYQRATDGQVWACIARSAGVETKKVTTTAPGTGAASMQTLQIDVYGSDRALFYIDGRVVAVVTSNIPTGAGRWTGQVLKVFKTAGVAVAGRLVVDWARYEWKGPER